MSANTRFLNKLVRSAGIFPLIKVKKGEMHKCLVGTVPIKCWCYFKKGEKRQYLRLTPDQTN